VETLGLDGTRHRPLSWGKLGVRRLHEGHLDLCYFDWKEAFLKSVTGSRDKDGIQEN
jgi:hypothetical protein